MKNFIKSKRFQFSMLVIACIGILGTCFLVNRAQRYDFRPEETISETDTQEVPAAPSFAADTKKDTSAPAPAEIDPMDEYPKVVDEGENEVVIDFTPEGEALMTEAPEPPVAEGDITDSSAPPEYAPEDTTLESPELPAQDNTPAPGSSNGKGAVYDPVFGWVTPGQVTQAAADSSGDPNKMVGIMGD